MPARSSPETDLFRVACAAVSGYAAGLGLGPLSVFAINARDVLRSGEQWPAWTLDYLLLLLVSSLPAAVNGAIGAGVASRWGSLGRRPVTVLPATLHGIVAVAALIREPQSVMGFQLYTLAFTAVIWSAGRIGQRIGLRGGPSTPNPTVRAD